MFKEVTDIFTTLYPWPRISESWQKDDPSEEIVHGSTLDGLPGLIQSLNNLLGYSCASAFWKDDTGYESLTQWAPLEVDKVLQMTR